MFAPRGVLLNGTKIQPKVVHAGLNLLQGPDSKLKEELQASGNTAHPVGTLCCWLPGRVPVTRFQFSISRPLQRVGWERICSQP